MIHIEEKHTSKLPGKTSLFVNFTYNPMIVETVKQCTVANYDKKTTTWEVPLTSLSFLLDRLSQIDDVEIVLLEEEEKKQHEKELDAYLEVEKPKVISRLKEMGFEIKS